MDVMRRADRGHRSCRKPNWFAPGKLARGEMVEQAKKKAGPVRPLYVQRGSRQSAKPARNTWRQRAPGRLLTALQSSSRPCFAPCCQDQTLTVCFRHRATGGSEKSIVRGVNTEMQRGRQYSQHLHLGRTGAAAPGPTAHTLTPAGGSKAGALIFSPGLCLRKKKTRPNRTTDIFS